MLFLCNQIPFYLRSAISIRIYLLLPLINSVFCFQDLLIFLFSRMSGMQGGTTPGRSLGMDEMSGPRAMQYICGECHQEQEIKPKVRRLAIRSHFLISSIQNTFDTFLWWLWMVFKFIGVIDKRQDTSDEDLKIISVRFLSGVVDKPLFFWERGFREWIYAVNSFYTKIANYQKLWISGFIIRLEISDFRIRDRDLEFKFKI